MDDPYNPTFVLAHHDDGTWQRARLLSQHLVHGVCRVTVAYSTGSGFTYWRAMSAEQCRPLPEPEDDQHDNAGTAQG